MSPWSISWRKLWCPFCWIWLCWASHENAERFTNDLNSFKCSSLEICILFFRPLIEPSNTFNWEIGGLVSQDLILTKKLCDVTGYAADKVGVREHHPWSPSTANSFASHSSNPSHINRSESVDSCSGYPPHPGSAGHSTAGYKDLIAEARNNFQIYLDSKIKNGPQLLPTPGSLNTADVNDEETTWISFWIRPKLKSSKKFWKNLGNISEIFETSTNPNVQEVVEGYCSGNLKCTFCTDQDSCIIYL